MSIWLPENAKVLHCVNQTSQASNTLIVRAQSLGLSYHKSSLILHVLQILNIRIPLPYTYGAIDLFVQTWICFHRSTTWNNERLSWIDTRCLTNKFNILCKNDWRCTLTSTVLISYYILIPITHQTFLRSVVNVIRLLCSLTLCNQCFCMSALPIIDFQSDG